MIHVFSQWAVSLAPSVLVGCLLGGVSRAEVPRVEFDASYAVGCRDVTPPEFARVHSDLKVIEAKLPISLLVREGEEKDITELMYVIKSPARRLRVADFLPKTRLGSNVADAIEVVETSENATSLDGSLSVQFRPLDAVQAMPSAGASKNHRRTLKRSYKKLPPKQLLLASGTTNHGHGVFFKLKPSSQASLEGQKEFVCLFVVPKGWTGDWISLECSATGWDRTFWTGGARSCGRRSFAVGLCLEGDQEARDAAKRVGETYEAYRRAKALAEENRLKYELSAGGLSPLLWHARIALENPTEWCKKVSATEKSSKEALRRARQHYENALTGMGRLAGG